MSDREYAERAIGAPGVMVLATYSERALGAIEAEFAAVRLEERRRIAAYLRSFAGLVPAAELDRERVAAFARLIDQIERGEYDS